MKVIGFSGSARKDGNTAIIMRIVLEELQKQGIDTELIQFAGQTIQPCRGCFECKDKHNCTHQSDMFFTYFDKMTSADGILLGSPVYSADVSSTMKAFLDRAAVVCAVNPGLLRHKVGASVSAVRRAGGMTAVDTMNHFLLSKEVVIAGSTYWNMVYGKDIGDVMRDDEGIRNMHNLGQNMAWLMQRLYG
jgi:multimeric flavodoxin WrbA